MMLDISRRDLFMIKESIEQRVAKCQILHELDPDRYSQVSNDYRELLAFLQSAWDS